jgi:hypothetical protein
MLDDVDDAPKTFKLVQLNDYLLEIDESTLIQGKKKELSSISLLFCFIRANVKVSGWKITFHQLTMARSNSVIEFDKFMGVCGKGNGNEGFIGI